MNKLFKNEYIYSVITRIITLSLSLAHSVLLARFLGAALQGTYAYIASITSVSSIILTFGMHQAYPYYRKKYGKDNIYNNYLSIIVGYVLIYAIICTIIFVTIQDYIELRVAILITPLMVYSNVIEYVALVENPNRRNTEWTIVYILDLVFIIFLFLFGNASFTWTIVIILFSYCARAIMFSFELKIKVHFEKKQLRFAVEMMKFGLMPMLALLMTTLNYKIDILMLKQYDIITASMVGVYAIGMNFADKIAIIPDTLKGVLVSKLAKGADEHEVAKICRLCFCVSVGIAICFLAIGEVLISLLYGKEYDGAYQVLILCSFGSIFVGYFKLIAQYNIINRKQVRNIVLLGSSIGINIVLNLALIPKFKLNGAAIASGVGYLVSGLIFVIWFSKLSSIKISEMFILQKEDIAYIKNMISNKSIQNNRSQE